MTRGWERPLLIVVTPLVAMIIGSAAYLGYSAFKFVRTASRIDILRAASDENTLIQARADNIRTDDTQPQIRERLFVTKEDYDEVRGTLSAKSAGLQDVTVDIGLHDATRLETAQAYRVPFTVKLEGSFPSVTAYLNALDRAPWLLVTEEVKIFSTGVDGGASRTKASIKGFVYLR